MTTTQQTLTLTITKRITYTAELDYETFSKHKVMKKLAEDTKRKLWDELWEDNDYCCDGVDFGEFEDDEYVDADDEVMETDYDQFVRDIVKRHKTEEETAKAEKEKEKAKVLEEMDKLKARLAELEKNGV